MLLLYSLVSIHPLYTHSLSQKRPAECNASLYCVVLTESRAVPGRGAVTQAAVCGPEKHPNPPQLE